MLHSSRLILAAVFATAACGKSVTGLDAVVVDDVVITATVPGPCRDGLACDPFSTAYPTLGLVTVHNRGTTPAYLRACGTYVAPEEQQLVDGQWQFTGPAITCPQGPPSIALAAGDSIQSNSWLAPGTWRFTLGVAPSADLSGETLATSAGVVVH